MGFSRNTVGDLRDLRDLRDVREEEKFENLDYLGDMGNFKTTAQGFLRFFYGKDQNS